MKYFLDTNIISYFLKGMYPQIKEHLTKVRRDSVFIPSIVASEIEYGARKSFDYEKTIKVYRSFLDVFEVVPFDQASAREYGHLRSSLEKEGKAIGANDMLIAATVLANGGILVTNNVNEFARVPGLKTENWTL